MADEFIRTTIETITTDGTIGNVIGSVAVGIASIACICMLYEIYKYLCASWNRAETRAAINDKKLRNEVYLDGVYSAYKAGLVHHTADKNGIEMKFNVIDEENGLMKKLDEEVNENLTN